MWTHQCFCLLSLDCISLAFIGLISKLTAELQLRSLQLCLFQAPSTFSAVWGDRYLGTQRINASLLMPLRAAGHLLDRPILFSHRRGRTRRPGVLLRSCPAGMQNVTLEVSHSWETHGRDRTKLHFFFWRCRSSNVLPSSPTDGYEERSMDAADSPHYKEVNPFEGNDDLVEWQREVMHAGLHCCFCASSEHQKGSLKKKS